MADIWLSQDSLWSYILGNYFEAGNLPKSSNRETLPDPVMGAGPNRTEIFGPDTSSVAFQQSWM